MMADGRTRWYAVRTAPGSQRMAKKRPPEEDETPEQEEERLRRQGESLIERSLRDGGFSVYMPGFWEIVRHQRTNRLMEKRFPFLIGYAFVDVREADFERVRSIDGVMGFMRPSSDRGPMVFPETEIGALMFAEFQRHRIYQVERETRLSGAQKYRRDQLNSRLGLIFPKGRRKKTPLRMMAESAIDSLSPTSRAQVRTILNELKAMDNEMEACRRSTSHLYSAA